MFSINVEAKCFLQMGDRDKYVLFIFLHNKHHYSSIEFMYSLHGHFTIIQHPPLSSVSTQQGDYLVQLTLNHYVNFVTTFFQICSELLWTGNSEKTPRSISELFKIDGLLSEVGARILLEYVDVEGNATVASCLHLDLS